jgi:hypothetical protein
MTLGFGRTIALVPHAAISPSLALSNQASHPASVSQFFPGAAVVAASYLLVLIILVVFGVCMGWQRPDGGGNGGRGPRRPPVREPTPPGGRQLDGDSPQPALPDDFAAWEGQLQAAEEIETRIRASAPDRHGHAAPRQR